MKQKTKRELIIRLLEGDEIFQGINTWNMLTSLKLFIHSATNLIEELGTLKNLQEFELVIFHGDSLERKTLRLPESFAAHPVLKRVKISSIFSGSKQQPFDLDQAARIFASCPCFESLSLSNLSVGEGWQNLSLLTGLKELKLEDLSFSGNPFHSIALLHKLEKLTIYKDRYIITSNITELPDIFGNLSELRKFVIANNFVQEIPPSLYSLDKLERLEITGAGVASLDEKIGKLQNLGRLNLSDNMLDKLPEEATGLPRLAALNIARNNFRREEITKIRSRLKPRFKSGEKIQFSTKEQGHEQEVKKLLAMNKTAITDEEVYYNQCLAAVGEEPFSVGYIDTERISSLNYGLVCAEAMKKYCFVLTHINPEKLDRSEYFDNCMTAARGNVGSFYHPIGLGPRFQAIRDDLLSDNQYIRVCIETALNNDIIHFHKYLNLKRLSREDYEHIWWVAILRYPYHLSDMIDPTPELCLHAAKHGARLHNIPESMRTYEICLLAARQGNAGRYKPSNLDDALKYVPPQFRDEQMLAALPKLEEAEYEDEPY